MTEQVPAGPPHRTSVSRFWSTVRGQPTWIAFAILAAPLLVVAIRALAGQWPRYEGEDVALIELRTRDVGTADTPLLGSYQRFGFNHPGPAWFYLLALPYRLTGSLTVGTVLVGLFSIGAALWVAAQHRHLWWVTVALGVLLYGARIEILTDPWEPHGLILPAAALFLLAFHCADGDDRALPVVAGVASLLAASWAVLAPYALAMGLVALIGLRRRIMLVATSAVLIVIWLPPLIQQMLSDKPNITAMLGARNNPEPSLGLRGAWKLVTLDLSHRSTYLGFERPLDGLRPIIDLGATPALPVLLVALVAAAVVWRERITLVALVAIGASIIGLSMLFGPVYLWIPTWLCVLGFGAVLATGWSVVRAVPTALFVAIAVALTATVALRAVTLERHPDRVSEAVTELVADLEVDLPEPVLVDSDLELEATFGGESAGIAELVLALDRLGIDAVVAEDLDDRFGPRRADPSRARSSLILVEVERGGVDPLPPDLRRERTELLDEMGLPVDAGPVEVLLAADRHPELSDIAAEVQRSPALPRLDLEVDTTPP